MQACQKVNKNEPMAILDADNFSKVNTSTQIDIEIQLCNCNGVKETELVPDVDVRTTKSGDVVLSSIITHLKEMGYILLGASISYYSHEFGGYIFCDVDPISDMIKIPPHELVNNKLIVLSRIDPATIVDTPLGFTRKRIRRETANKKRNRIRARKIGQVIEQVKVWRRYYTGYTDYHGKQIKLSLQEAATKVGVPKKSLDDYFLQLRMGKLYGFDFNGHKNDNIGVLRTFIKNIKKDKVNLLGSI